MQNRMQNECKTHAKRVRYGFGFYYLLIPVEGERDSGVKPNRVPG
jgi:hypothetical protein